MTRLVLPAETDSEIERALPRLSIMQLIDGVADRVLSHRSHCRSSIILYGGHAYFYLNLKLNYLKHILGLNKYKKNVYPVGTRSITRLYSLYMYFRPQWYSNLPVKCINTQLGGGGGGGGVGVCWMRVIRTLCKFCREFNFYASATEGFAGGIMFSALSGGKSVRPSVRTSVHPYVRPSVLYGGRYHNISRTMLWFSTSRLGNSIWNTIFTEAYLNKFCTKIGQKVKCHIGQLMIFLVLSLLARYLNNHLWSITSLLKDIIYHHRKSDLILQIL